MKSGFRRGFSLCIAFFLLLGAVPQFFVFSAPTASRKIRVGFPLQAGLTQWDENGEFSGYTYEYLMEIAQYTGWEYEFVKFAGDMDEQISAAMESLKLGEIDLLGGLYFDDALTDFYAYPGYGYGINYMGLFVPTDSAFSESSLYTSERLRVAVHSQALQPDKKLKQFAQMNNLQIEQLLAQDAQQCKVMLAGARADMLLSTDLTMAGETGMRSIAHFSPMPFYLATTKGNTEILRQLDYALSTIRQVNPNFQTKTYNKYFLEGFSQGLTTAELAFIERAEVLKVAMYRDMPPFSYFNEKTGRTAGITSEILDVISQATGLKFSFALADTYEEYRMLLESGEIDIVANVPLNPAAAQATRTSLTQPWHTLPSYAVFRENEGVDENSLTAIPYTLKNTFPEVRNPLYFDTGEECMQAVVDGRADRCYIDVLSGQYHLNSPAFAGLKALNLADAKSQKLCFGVRNASDFYLLSIINKTVAGFSEEAVGEILYRNTYRRQEISMATFLQQNRAIVIAMAASLIAAILLIYLAVKMRRERRVAFENRRYNLLSDLANEYFYEYDIARDQLDLPDRCAAFFGCGVKIDRFARRLLGTPVNERNGIWQLGEHIVGGEEGCWEISCAMPGGKRQWFKIITAAVREKERRISVVGKISDIQVSKTEQVRLEQRATTDGLTGILNIQTAKRKIIEMLENLGAHAPCALLIMDVDNFKKINDVHGHYNGDAVLVQVASLLSSVFPNSVFGRLGGDEFVVFSQKTDRTALEQQCRLLEESVAEKTKSMLGEAFTMSIGISFVEFGQNYEELYREADGALYKVKTTGKNGFAFYENILS